MFVLNGATSGWTRSNFERPNGQDCVAKKIEFYIPFLFVESLTADHSNFTQSLGEIQQHLYIQKFGNSVVVEFCVVLTSVTNSRDIGSFWPAHCYWFQVYL